MGTTVPLKWVGGYIEPLKRVGGYIEPLNWVGGYIDPLKWVGGYIEPLKWVGGSNSEVGGILKNKTNFKKLSCFNFVIVYLG